MHTVLSKALREFTTGPLNQLIVNLGGQEGHLWEEELKKFLRKEPSWNNPMSSTLELVSTVQVSATTNKFVSKDNFVVNTTCNAPVKISIVRSNFTNWFLLGEGKIEDTISEQALHYHKLRKVSVDDSIITELGGETKVETSLTEIFSLMEKQKNGEDGVLLNNGYVNIFYVRDISSILRGVCVGWRSDGWFVGARSVGHPYGWRHSYRVFSRNSVLDSELPALTQS
jgi:hypothetical protein